MTEGRRPRHTMPDDVAARLDARKLRDRYDQRPAYQRNDYLGWIMDAKTDDTRNNRIDQMLDELKGGNTYMKMPWHDGSAKPD